MYLRSTHLVDEGEHEGSVCLDEQFVQRHLIVSEQSLDSIILVLPDVACKRTKFLAKQSSLFVPFGTGRVKLGEER